MVKGYLRGVFSISCVVGMYGCNSCLTAQAVVWLPVVRESRCLGLDSRWKSGCLCCPKLSLSEFFWYNCTWHVPVDIIIVHTVQYEYRGWYGEYVFLLEEFNLFYKQNKSLPNRGFRSSEHECGILRRVPALSNDMNRTVNGIDLAATFATAYLAVKKLSNCKWLLTDLSCQ